MQVEADRLDQFPTVHSFELAVPTRAYLLERLVNLVLAVILSVLVLPLFLLLVVIIRLDSPGPAIFCQKRLGQNLLPFTFYKFRTMHQDAATRFPELYDYVAMTGGDFLFKVPRDPRITRIGRLIRRLGIDELPNLINVIKGDCSLVGPRPDIPEMLAHYTAAQRLRFSVPQGVVSLAHIRGGNKLTFAQTAELDVEYVQRRSVWLDIRILAAVAISIVKGDLH